ncbi:MAG: hypothetical protein ACK5NK_12985 [Niabella sp.]
MTTTSTSFAQDDEPVVQNANQKRVVYKPSPEPENGFKKANLFTGGGVSLSFGSGFTALGASPIIGYRLNNYVDAGLMLNYIYTSMRDYRVFNDKLSQQNFGPGAFIRAYPVPFLFAQVQPEYNFISQKYTAGSSVSKYNAGAPSLLLGGGFATGRIKGGTTFFYMSLLFDVIKDENSPYVDVDYDPVTGEQRVRMVPLIRAGVNIGLFGGRYRNGGYY